MGKTAKLFSLVTLAETSKSGPGTGKTLTAERYVFNCQNPFLADFCSGAEFCRKPLYRVTGGDVGTTPDDAGRVRNFGIRYIQ
jgi:hypothetical protein